MENNIKKAFESAEQEIQEKEILHLKNLIKDLLQKKKNKEQEKRNVEHDLKIIVQTIEDFKKGRLDKIKELLEQDENAAKLVPIEITIINQNNSPTRPWLWQYHVAPTTPIYVSQNAPQTTAVITGGLSTGSFISSSLGAHTLLAGSLGHAGTMYANFTGGTYALTSGETIILN